MRPPAAPFVLLTILVLPSAQASWPDLEFSLPAFESLNPGTETTAAGTLRFEFPPDTSCTEPLAFEITLADAPSTLDVRVEPSSSVVPPEFLQPGGNHTVTFEVIATAGPQAPAYELAVFRFNATTRPCGTLNDARALAQGYARFAFEPKVGLRLEAENETHWTVIATNQANAPIRVDWSLVQEDVGQVWEAGTLDLPGLPSTARGAEANFSVPKALVNTSFPAEVDAQVYYAGPQQVSVHVPGSARLRVHPPETAADDEEGVSSVAWTYVLGAALVLGSVGWAFAQRRRRGRAP